MSQVFDEVAGKFARDADTAMHGGYYLRGQLFMNLARQYIPVGASVLDYGCGPGRLSLLLSRSGFRVRGVDTSPGMIAQANGLEKAAWDIKFETIQAGDEMGAPQQYDAIVCSSVIEYVPDPDALLLAFNRSLRPGGTLIISYANQSSWWRHHWARLAAVNPMQTSQHQTWSRSEFEALLKRNGFKPGTRPLFFESPSDAWPGSALLRHSARIGSIGLLAAFASH